MGNARETQMVLKKDLRFFYGTRESRIFKTISVLSLPTLKIVQISTSESRALLPGLRNCLLSPTSF
jgi:methylphosphotriester-DNA--protein-cysteine methyltransferase